MSNSVLMTLVPMWLLMIFWLGLVGVSGFLAFKKWQKTTGSTKKQMFILWLGPVFVFIGDALHTVAFTVSTYTGDTTGCIEVFGTIFEFRTFAMFFDGLVFIVYYAMWALFIVERYHQGRFDLFDKIRVGLAVAAIALILPGAIPNALGIYTLEYNIAIWAPHMVLFIVFGLMTVWKLISCSRHAFAQAADGITKTQEKALSVAGKGFVFSFLFFILSLGLIPVNEMFGLFMIPKTFAYVVAFFSLIKGVILPAPQA